MNNKKILIVNKTNDYISYLMKIQAIKIQQNNNCYLSEVTIDEYTGEYGKVDGPSILLIKNEKLINVISGFKYFKKIPKF